MSRPVLRNPELVWREEPAERDEILQALARGEEASDRGWVVLVERGHLHELNLMAGEIWLLADGTRDAHAIARDLAERYEAPLEEIRADVESFLSECDERGWLL